MTATFPPLNCSRRRGLAVVLFLFLTGQAPLWPREGNMLYIGPDHNPLIELTSLAEVRSELRLTDEQSRAVEALRIEHLAEAMREVGSEDSLPGVPNSEFRVEAKRRLIEVQNRYRPRLAEILKPAQLTRLEEITLQFRGTPALSESDLAAKLGLRAEQQERLAAIDKEARTAELDWMRQTPKRTKSDREAFYKEHRPYFDKERLAVLDEQQRKQWDTLMGRPFTLPKYVFAAMGIMRPQQRPR